MSELKTQPTKASVAAFLKSIEDADRRADCQTVARIMEKATKAKPVMWSNGLVGFGNYRYKYASGREGDWMLTAFALRQGKLTVYVMPGYTGGEEMVKSLGKVSGSKSCIHIKRLSDIHLPTLTRMINASVKHLQKISKPA
ncbi:MAG: DUF1801 domain-containing protein [Vicinamibacterales bacterium]